MQLHDLRGPAGPLEALLDEPARERGINQDGLLESATVGRVRSAVVFAHPHPQYGGTMHTKVVYQSAKALARIGCAVLRFNFRGVGTSAGTFDEGRGEMDDFRAAVDYVAARYPGTPVWAAGMSFGAWVALTAGAGDERVSTLLGVSMPVDHFDLETIRASVKPKFFIHGERDEIGALKSMREFYARCSDPKELVVIDAADHLFDGKVSEVADAIEDLLGDWSS